MIILPSRILKGELLLSFRDILYMYVIITFKYRTRTFNFSNLPFRDRCLNCSLLFVYIKDKRRTRYCSPECSDKFHKIYPQWEDLRWQIAYENKYRCNICRKSVIYIREEIVNTLLGMKNEIPYRDWSIEDHKTIIDYTKIYEDAVFDLDHIIELSTANNQLDMAKLHFDKDNLQILCKSCHRRKTGKFLSGRTLHNPKNIFKNRTNLSKYLFGSGE